MAKKPQYNNDSIVALKEEQRVRQKPPLFSARTALTAASTPCLR